jgi:hypothetical protein
VFLALLQIFGPLGSIFVSAHVNHVGFFEMSRAIWIYSRPWDLIEFYALPIVQGVMIFLAKRFGYYIVIALAIFSVYLNVHEWRIANDVISIPVLIGVTASNLGLIVYLLLPSVRAVFMNPRLRWWETPPRYTVNLPGQISKADGHGFPCKIVDISVGGAGVQTEGQTFEQNEAILLMFERDGRTLLMRAVVVYGRADGTNHRYGIEWRRGIEDDEARLVHFLEDLESKRAPINRPPPQWREDLAAWWSRAKKSPSAWVPEVPKKKP